MRDLHPKARRTPRRAAFRARYAAYVVSPAWQRRRRQWFERRIAADAAPRCVVCDRPWTLADDLHHATYERLGREHDTDLWPMCRVCHEALHRLLDLSRYWRRLPRPVATAALVAALRRLSH